MEAGSPLDRVFLLGVGVLGLIIIAKRRSFPWSIVNGNIWVAAIMVYMLVSISWSGIPFISFKRWSREIIALIMCICIVSEEDPYKAVRSVLRRLIYIYLPFSLMLIKYYPDLGVFYSNSGIQCWMGMGLHKNTLSNLCTLVIVYLVWTFVRRRWAREKAVVWYQAYVEVFLLALSVYLLLGPNHTLTNSATSLITSIVGLTALAVLFWMQLHGRTVKSNALTITVLFLVIYGTITPFLGGLSLIDISSLVGRDESLTGRSSIWASLTPYVWSSPIVGYGFGGFWTDAMREKVMAAHPHNGYLDVILNTGFFGLFLFSMFIIRSCRYAENLLVSHADWGALWSCYLLITVMNNITEASATSLSSTNVVVLLLMGFAAFAAGGRKEEGDKEFGGHR